MKRQSGKGRRNRRAPISSKGRKSAFESIRWTLTQAAAEFGLNPRTVVTRAKVAGLMPGEDGRFSTAEVHAAICGDYERERIRKLKEEADWAALDNAEHRKEVVDKPELLKRFESTFAEMKQAIMGSKLSDKEKDALCAKLAGLQK